MMPLEPKNRRLEQIEASLRRRSAGPDDIRDRLLRAIKGSSSDEALQRLIELAARCVSESAAWDAFAEAQDAGAAASWTEIQRLEREAFAAKQARILIVDRLRAEMDD